MSKYIIRLDDASEYMDELKWNRIINLLDDYAVKPLISVIPDNKDEDLVGKYTYNESFWNEVNEWQNKGYSIALHGFNHVFHKSSGGINPVNYYSEFADLTIEEQLHKIECGLKIFKDNDIRTNIFVAPAHTFDLNTIKALTIQGDIKIISDKVSSKPFYFEGMHFIPQQMGHVRNFYIPMKLITFCYHPNNMTDIDFDLLEEFLKKYNNNFVEIKDVSIKKRKLNLYDKLLSYLYFRRRK